MNIVATALCRIYQSEMRLAMRLFPVREPTVISGEGSSEKVPSLLHERGFLRPLLITSPTLDKLDLLDPLKASLEKANYHCAVFNAVIPCPTFDTVYAAKEKASKNNCDSIIAVGGSSVIDTAKAVGALLANPRASLPSLRGVLKVHRGFRLLIAIPTTAGSGSEATAGAAITNPKTKEKIVILDPRLVPSVVVLDGAFLSTLSKPVIAAKGMKALSHAIEAYISRSRTKVAKRDAIEAIRLLASSLLPYYENANDVAARDAVLRASYLAGVSFGESFLGYAHAISYSLNLRYEVKEGLASAIVLPYLLRQYGKSVTADLARLSEALTLLDYQSSSVQKANAFIRWFEMLRSELRMAPTFHHLIQNDDILSLAKIAAKEANPLYPVPHEMSAKELMSIYKEIDSQ